MINLKSYGKKYFYLDKPVPFELKNKNLQGEIVQLNIEPVKVQDSEIFLSSVFSISQDKNSSNSVEIIQMSYLEYLYKVLLPTNELAQAALINIIILCLGLKHFNIYLNDSKKPFIYDQNKQCIITEKEFDNICKIILHQNLVHYDDKYINPEAKQAMQEIDEIKNKDYEEITLERRIAIITAHCGISKKEQLEMTMRSHNLLFEEVAEEVEYVTTRPVLLFEGKGEESQWIYKKKKDKFSKYFTSDKQYNKSMGGDGQISQVETSNSSRFNEQYNSFNK